MTILSRGEFKRSLSEEYEINGTKLNVITDGITNLKVCGTYTEEGPSGVEKIVWRTGNRWCKMNEGNII